MNFFKDMQLNEKSQTEKGAKGYATTGSYLVDLNFKIPYLRTLAQDEDFPYEEAGIRPDYKWRVGKKTIPVYHYGDGDERQIIWGMTGRIVSWFVSEMERAGL